METVPLVMRFIRTEMRSRRAPLLAVPQFRVLTLLGHAFKETVVPRRR
jgi:hypothetical protein